MVMQRANDGAGHERVAMADGTSLAVVVRGPRGAPTVLFAHGFGQTRDAWADAAGTLAARGVRSVCFDARGHGDSDHAADGVYGVQQFVVDVATLAQVQPEPPVLVGASMGGLLGLAVAGEWQPAPLAGLVLVDIVPDWEGAGVERVLAFMRAHPRGFADLDRAAAAVAAYVPHRRRRRDPAGLARLLRRGADGRWYWHWDPALLASVPAQGERARARLRRAAAAVRIPTLLLSGEHSDVVSHRAIEDFTRLVPHARHVEVAGATHMLAGDANDAFTGELVRFLDIVFDPTETGTTGQEVSSCSSCRSSPH